MRQTCNRYLPRDSGELCRPDSRNVQITGESYFSADVCLATTWATAGVIRDGVARLLLSSGRFALGERYGDIWIARVRHAGRMLRSKGTHVVARVDALRTVADCR